MHLTALLPLLLSAALTSAKPHPFITRRTTTTDTTIYAYGTNISGLPLVYGNSDGIPLFSSLVQMQANHPFRACLHS
jgi:hypothetical protein